MHLLTIALNQMTMSMLVTFLGHRRHTARAPLQVSLSAAILIMMVKITGGYLQQTVQTLINPSPNTITGLVSTRL